METYGPGLAISSWFQGAFAVQVFNAMGYDVTAVGNHYFDFDQEMLLTIADADRAGTAILSLGPVMGSRQGLLLPVVPSYLSWTSSERADTLRLSTP
jgi:hypothetical protein